jgi:transposase
MTTIAAEAAGREGAPTRDVVGGVDTHKDTHTAAVIDTTGRLLGSRCFAASGAGYAALLAWLSGFGRLVLVGIEGTGVYGAGLAEHLQHARIALVEVDRPDRKSRRFAGKSDPLDAEAAARAGLARVRTGHPKQRGGPVDALRTLRVARRSAVAQRADVMRQLKAVLVTAPERWQALTEEVTELDALITVPGLHYGPTRKLILQPYFPHRGMASLRQAAPPPHELAWTGTGRAAQPTTYDPRWSRTVRVRL